MAGKCNDCRWFYGGNKCEHKSGTTSPTSTCGLFVDYTGANIEEKCNFCRWFSERTQCEQKSGTTSPNSTCVRFTPFK